MLFSTGGNVIDIDVVRTKELYYESLYIWQRCHCPVCRNFDENIQSLGDKKLRFLKELGIEPNKCYDLWPYEPGDNDGTQKYILMYPVICRTVQYDISSEEWYTLENGLSIAIIINSEGAFLKLDWELKWMHR